MGTWPRKRASEICSRLSTAMLANLGTFGMDAEITNKLVDSEVFVLHPRRIRRMGYGALQHDWSSFLVRPL